MKSNKERAQKRERSAAKELGGRSVIGSGSLWFDKGDIKTDKFLIEDKFTDNDSYKIELSIYTIIEKQAAKVHKVPIYRFGFEKYGTNYVIFHTGYFLEQLNHLDEFVHKIEVYKKSVTVYHDFFEKLEISTQGNILCYLLFIKNNNTIPFAVMTWETFKKTQELFIA